jgi:hypothetical protein
MELQLKHPAAPPLAETLVIIFAEGRSHGEPGCWDGSVWTDLNGFEQTITHWADFPKRSYIPAQDPRPAPKPARRLLVVACSATKSNAAGEMPAIERYNGAYYQMVKGHQGELPEIVILSAEHGFIRADTPIQDYDRMMDKARAAELLPNAHHHLGAALEHEQYDEVLIAAGKAYRDVIFPAFRALRGVTTRHMTWVQGGIGAQRSQLKKWLSKHDQGTGGGSYPLTGGGLTIVTDLKENLK